MVDSLRELVEDLIQSSPERSRRARLELVTLGSAAVDELLRWLPVCNDQQRWRLLIVLSEIGDERAVPAFIDCLRSPLSAIQAAAAQFLGSAGDRRAVEPLLDALTRDANATAQVWIVQALGKLQDERAVEPLLALVESTESASVRYTAIEALGWLGDARAVPVICRYAEDDSHHVRARVAGALQRLLPPARYAG